LGQIQFACCRGHAANIGNRHKRAKRIQIKGFIHITIRDD